MLGKLEVILLEGMEHEGRGVGRELRNSFGEKFSLETGDRIKL